MPLLSLTKITTKLTDCCRGNKTFPETFQPARASDLLSEYRPPFTVLHMTRPGLQEYRTLPPAGTQHFPRLRNPTPWTQFVFVSQLKVMLEKSALLFSEQHEAGTRFISAPVFTQRTGTSNASHMDTNAPWNVLIWTHTQWFSFKMTEQTSGSIRGTQSRMSIFEIKAVWSDTTLLARRTATPSWPSGTTRPPLSCGATSCSTSPKIARWKWWASTTASSCYIGASNSV